MASCAIWLNRFSGKQDATAGLRMCCRHCAWRWQKDTRTGCCFCANNTKAPAICRGFCVMYLFRLAARVPGQPVALCLFRLFRFFHIVVDVRYVVVLFEAFDEAFYRLAGFGIQLFGVRGQVSSFT